MRERDKVSGLIFDNLFINHRLANDGFCRRVGAPLPGARPPVSIRALIVDDEPLGRQRIRSLVKNEPDFEIVGECGDGRDGLAAIREQRADLVFLDEQMPGLDGFGVLEAVRPEEKAAGAFVTAFATYSVREDEIDGDETPGI